MAVHILAP